MSRREKKGKLFTFIEFDPYRKRQKKHMMTNEWVMMAAVGPLETSMVEFEVWGTLGQARDRRPLSGQNREKLTNTRRAGSVECG